MASLPTAGPAFAPGIGDAAAAGCARHWRLRTMRALYVVRKRCGSSLRMARLPCARSGRGPGAGATLEEAAQRFEAESWPAGAAAYQEIVDREPANALALIRLARARAANGEAAAALAALAGLVRNAAAARTRSAMTLPEFATPARRPALRRAGRTAPSPATRRSSGSSTSGSATGTSRPQPRPAP